MDAKDSQAAAFNKAVPRAPLIGAASSAHPAWMHRFADKQVRNVMFRGTNLLEKLYAAILDASHMWHTGSGREYSHMEPIINARVKYNKTLHLGDKAFIYRKYFARALFVK